MKKMMIVVMVFGLMMVMGNHNEQEAKIAAQAAQIQQLTESNEAYFEGMQVQKLEAERLNRVNQHYAQIMSAK